MKAPATLIIILASLFTAFADFPSIEGLTSHLFTNAVIVWQAPTNGLPQSFWIYHRMLPRIFSETIISNAIVLGSLQGKGFPRPSTNDLFIPEDVPPNWPGPIFPIFYMRPSDATLSYEMQGYAKDSDKAAKGIPDDQTITARAWKYAGQLGLDRNQLAVKSFYTHFCDAGENQTVETNAICGRGVFLARQLDGISFSPPMIRAMEQKVFLSNLAVMEKSVLIRFVGRMFSVAKMCQSSSLGKLSITSGFTKYSFCPMIMR